MYKSIIAGLIAAVPFLSFGTAGLAQELVYSDALISNCLADSGEEYEATVCIGISSGNCMEQTQGGYSTVGMGFCLDAELSFWDGVLNAQYKLARTRAREADAANGTPKALEQALQDMQRAWIGFRDATCDFERGQWGGGTGAGPAGLSCLMNMTGAQAIYLKNSGFGG
jgi:uncharacterized protein YecT (DUF1311 family)